MYKIEELIKMAGECGALVNGRYVPARPLPWDYGYWFSVRRLKDAWAVLLGNADAVEWEGQ